MNEEEFIGVIKLISGEEIIGKISHSENGGKIILECPAVMNSSIDRQVGVNVVKIEPWIKTGRETEYVLDMNKIVTIIEVVDKEVTTQAAPAKTLPTLVFLSCLIFSKIFLY